jgi:N-acetylglucosamine-6-sulfatase
MMFFHMRYQTLCTIFLALIGAFVTSSAADTRPNFLVIISDDQRTDTVDVAMPNVSSRIFQQGVSFENGIITTPLCCPSRSSIFTGMYASKHGVKGNRIKLKIPTMMNRLQAAGYYTGLVGKYLNSHKGNPLSAYDYWVSHKGGSSDYYNPILNVEGQWKKIKGYISYVLRDFVLEFLERATTEHSSQPFVLLFTPNAPHYKAQPAPEDEGMFSDLALTASASTAEHGLKDKPKWLREIAASEVKKKHSLPNSFQIRQYEALFSLDKAIGTILDAVEAKGLLDNTVVIFISDNGLMFDEHYLRGKNVPYEEALRVPFAIRYPKRFPVGVSEERVVANIDIRPTIEELAELPPDPEIDGVSLLGLYDGITTWRTGILFEGWPTGRPRFEGVRTQTQKLIRTLPDHFVEVYDLKYDPLEMNSVAKMPAHKATKDELMKLLQELKD